MNEAQQLPQTEQYIVYRASSLDLMFEEARFDTLAEAEAFHRATVAEACYYFYEQDIIPASEFEAACDAYEREVFGDE